MHHSLLKSALFSLFAVTAGANAQIYNPNNDAQTFFAINMPVQSAVKPSAGVARMGDVSPDGAYAWSGGERGWTNRQHSYELVAGHLVHSADCLAYDNPKPKLTDADFRAMYLAERASDR